MSNTIISNPSVENIKQSLIKDGIDSFHIVADFDRTLTPAQVNGEFTTTSFAKIRKGKVLSEEYEKLMNYLIITIQ